MPARIAFVSDSCLVTSRHPLAAFLEHWAAGRANEAWIRACLRTAESEYARGSDAEAVAAGLLTFLDAVDGSAAAGRAWLAAVASRHRCPEIANVLARHRSSGDEVVVVTELPQPRPAFALVDGLPVAVIGSRLPAGGHDVGEAMVGEQRVAAIARHAEAARVPLSRCCAYGASPSDVPMLRAVGVPIAVGARSALLGTFVAASAPASSIIDPPGHGRDGPVGGRPCRRIPPAVTPPPLPSTG